jgi:outer membrane protein OmpA-like peptidoglycan-associated protein
MRNALAAIVFAVSTGCSADVIQPVVQPHGDLWFFAFFDSGSAVLDAKALTIVEQFAEYCPTSGKYRISLTGHTDTVGSATYNGALSLRRAEAIKQALIGRGVPADRIATSGRGAAQLLIQTQDQVKEPQNRRVEFYCQQVPP